MKHNDREVIFGECHATDLLKSIKPWTYKIGQHAPTVATFPNYEGKGGQTHLSGYASWRGHSREYSGVEVQPTEAVIQAIDTHTLHVPYDTMNLELIDWSDGRTLVTVHYGQIIGTHYLGIVPTAELDAIVAQ